MALLRIPFGSACRNDALEKRYFPNFDGVFVEYAYLYDRICRVERVMRPYLEILVAWNWVVSRPRTRPSPCPMRPAAPGGRQRRSGMKRGSERRPSACDRHRKPINYTLCPS
jgi:hypothetical protein